MVMRGSSQNYGKGGGWKGAVFLLFLVFISVLNVNIGGRTIAFIFLPLMGVCLWPRTDKTIQSILVIFLMGLFLDLLSAGPLGLWALIFLTVFGVFRPHMRSKPHNFRSAFTLWIMALIIAFIASFLLGWFALGSRPEFTVLVYQALAALVLFPLIYAIRHLGRYILTDPDLRGM